MSTQESRTDAGPQAESLPVEGAAAKRLFDLVLSLPLCLVAAPVVFVLAVVLAVHHGAWPLFVHNRVGDGGRLVAIPKLRTLAPTVHPYADKTVVQIEARSRLARFLRSSHLDELPQLFLVPLGRLSLVGPRPRMVSERDEHGDEVYESIRTSVPQGCTGLWQVSGQRGRVSDSPEYDRFYVEQQSLRLDVWILWRTLRQMFVKGDANLEEVPLWALRRPELVRAGEI